MAKWDPQKAQLLKYQGSRIAHYTPDAMQCSNGNGPMIGHAVQHIELLPCDSDMAAGLRHGLNSMLAFTPIYFSLIRLPIIRLFTANLNAEKRVESTAYQLLT